jgi:hypothetical protein
MTMTRSDRLDAAVATAGQLVSALLEKGPLTQAQVALLIRAAGRAAVPNFQDWEAHDAARRVLADIGAAMDSAPIFARYKEAMRKRQKSKQEPDLVTEDDADGD